MKKLILAFAIAASAVVANAATVTWTASAVQKSPVNADYTQFMAYIIDNAAYAIDTEGWSYTTAIEKSAFHKELVKTSATADSGKLPSGVRFDDAYIAGNTPTYYMVILDGLDVATAKYYQVSATKSATVTSTGALSMGFGSQAGNVWTEAVPEPTSGLLLLLGMAGLALKRKVA